VLPPVQSGRALLADIDGTISTTPTLWWLGHRGFVMRFATITFYIDPCLSLPPQVLDPADVRHADLILVNDARIDPAIRSILISSPRAKVVIPKSATDAAVASGIPLDRMTTTDADLRVEYFKDNLYGRVYAVPSANPTLDYSPTSGYPYLGYLIRFGRWTVYHAGGCAMYEGLADRLRPFNVNVALLPIGEGYFSVSEAADLAAAIGAAWIVAPADSGASSFVSHMLGHRPAQRFKVLQCGAKWSVPEE
jgi:L-ascorbate metabolism protein UlaG (beta-lactamase superfamily)